MDGVLALVPIVVIATTIWVYYDAQTQGNKQSPLWWAIGCLLLWIFVFPWYVATRKVQGA
jgi:uncharacterized membrane protein YhdT